MRVHLTEGEIERAILLVLTSKWGENMLKHINNLRLLHDQLKEMGVNIDDKELAMTVLASLPKEFKLLITALDAVGEDNISFEKVKGMLLNDNDRWKDAKKCKDAFSIQRGNGKQSRGGGNQEKKPEKTFCGTCYFCQERGHFVRDCLKRKTQGSSTKALSVASQEAVWLSRLFKNVGVKQEEPILIYEDNQGAIELSRNPKFHNRTKHIDIAYHFIREKVKDKVIYVKYCETEQMLADIMGVLKTKTSKDKTPKTLRPLRPTKLEN